MVGQQSMKEKKCSDLCQGSPKKINRFLQNTGNHLSPRSRQMGPSRCFFNESSRFEPLPLRSHRICQLSHQQDEEQNTVRLNKQRRFTVPAAESTPCALLVEQYPRGVNLWLPPC